MSERHLLGSDGVDVMVLKEIRKLKNFCYPYLQSAREILFDFAVRKAVLVFREESFLVDLLGSGRIRLSEGQKKTVVKSVLMALNHMHHVNVCHGNLCLENVLYSVDGEVRLSDWFLTAALPNPEVRFAVAPERLLAPFRAPPTPFSDVWSAGVLAASLILGATLFFGENVHTQLRFGELKGGETKKKSRF